MSCAASSEVVDLDDEAKEPSVTTLAEVTVEGSPEAEDPDALKDAKITLRAPFEQLHSIAVKNEQGGETKLVVTTSDGVSHPVTTPFVSWFEDDPGCPSIERESAIIEVRAEGGAIVVLTKSDRGFFDNDENGELEMVNARACRMGDDDTFECSEKEIVSAELVTYEGDERRVKRSFKSRWWVDADGEIEVDQAFDGFSTGA